MRGVPPRSRQWWAQGRPCGGSAGGSRRIPRSTSRWSGTSGMSGRPISDAEVNGANGHMSCLGPRSELIPVAEQRGLEHILVAEESISTAELRRLIGDCKRFGLSLTLVAPNAELLGPGIQLNRLGELPLLDFAFSDPSRSTMALKRGIDIVVSAGHAPPAGAAAPGRGHCDQARLPWPRAVQAGQGRQGGQAFHDAEVPDDGARRRREDRRSRGHADAGRAVFQGPQRSRDTRGSGAGCGASVWTKHRSS